MKHVNVTFPLIEDIRMEVANKYGMIQPNASNTQAVRAVFVVDPNGKNSYNFILPTINWKKL